MTPTGLGWYSAALDDAARRILALEARERNLRRRLRLAHVALRAYRDGYNRETERKEYAMGFRIAITVTARKDPRSPGRTNLEVISLIPPHIPSGSVSTMEQIEDKIIAEQRAHPDAEIMVITCSQNGGHLRIARPTAPSRVGWKAGHAPELC